MTCTRKRCINLLIPRELAGELHALVPPRQRGRVISEALAGELQRGKVLAAIEQSAGAWSDAAHPELATGQQIDRRVAKGRRRLGWDRPRSGRRQDAGQR